MQDIDLADRMAGRHPLAWKLEAEALLEHAIGRTVAGAFLRKHHAAFAVDGALANRQFGGHFAQQLQRGVDGVFVGLRQVELVDGLVEVGGRVGVGAEGQAVAFQDLDHLALGHGLGAVEGHVLQEVGETLLGVGFHQRAGVEAQAQRRLAGRDRLAVDGVAHAVGQRAETGVRVSADIGAGLWPFAGRELVRLGLPAEADLRHMRQFDRIGEA